MSPLTTLVMGFSVVIGLVVGGLARIAPRGDGWLFASLGMSAVVVALAQQTLP